VEWHIAFAIIPVALIALLLLRMPVAFAMGLVAIVGIALVRSPAQMAQLAIEAITRGMEITFAAVPLFILMAELLSIGGIAKDLFDAAHRLLKRLPGSLAVASIVGCAMFGAMCGSSPATTAVIGSMAVPEMLRRKYEKRLATGAVSAAGGLAILIPPSLSMIIYGMMTETSISALFIAGVLPGILITGLMVLYILVRVLLRPELAPRWERENTVGGWTSLVRTIPAVAIVVGVLGSIYTGIASVTESAALGAGAALVVAASRGQLKWNYFAGVLERSARTTSMIMFLLISGFTLSFLLNILRIPQELSAAIAGANASPYLTFALVFGTYILLGMFIDSGSMLVITLPIFFPIMMGAGFHPLWFGVVATVACEIAMIHPPVGMNLFVMKSITPPEVSMNDIAWGAVPYIGIYLLGLLILTLFPALATWLPATMR
jgi:C4-dicarboxylate transporter, DctM subunit